MHPWLAQENMVHSEIAKVSKYMRNRNILRNVLLSYAEKTN